MLSLNQFYKCLFFVVVSIYSFVLSQFGFENWDTGFMTGLSWRVLNGQRVYQDFLLIRPPVTVLFHSIFLKILPEVGQLYYIKGYGYLLFGFQVFLTVYGTNNIYNLQKLGINKWAVMSVAFIISIHNFFPNPWPNVDGIFFASIAFYIFATQNKSNIFILFITAFCCMLSALCKQSFYFIPIIFATWLFILEKFKSTIYFLCFIAFFAILYISFLKINTDFKTYIEQTSYHTSKSDLFKVGFLGYLNCYKNNSILGLVITLPLLYTLYFSERKQFNVRFFLKNLSISIFISAIISLFIIDFKLSTNIFFNATVVAFFYKIDFSWEKLKKYFPTLVILGIAWSSSLSLGYPYPILYTTGILLAFLILLHDEIIYDKLKNYILILTAPICLFFIYTNRYLYREKDIFQLKYSLEEISPKLKYIKSSKETYEKHMELRNLVSNHSDNFVVLPNIPLAHYLFNKNNQIPGEWFTNFEINDKHEDYLKIIKEKKTIVFIEKSFLDGEVFLENNLKGRKQYSQLSVSVVENFELVKRLKYFEVYKPKY